MSFDGFQRDVLAELGLAVYALAGAGAAPALASATPPAPANALLGALLRAAAAEGGREDALMLCREFLAANPAPSAQARRAFWPQLRRLRARAA